jgi:catechol 2,3-dioxygenase-like lactoylglutathione lyase family enzyme
MRVHISLPASDLEKSHRFYSSVFGTGASKLEDDYLNFRLEQPAIHLALVKKDDANAHPAEHFGIELPDAATFQEWNDRLSAVVESDSVLAEPDAKCCYARADKIWVTDPDGHRWEIWHRTGEYEALTEKPSTCC